VIIQISNPEPRYLLVFLHLGSRHVWISASSVQPDSAWVSLQARNFLMVAEDMGLTPEYVMRDNDAKYSGRFDEVLKSSGAKVKRNTPMSPNLRAHVERFLQTLKFECLNKFVNVAEKLLIKSVGSGVAITTRNDRILPATTFRRNSPRHRRKSTLFVSVTSSAPRNSVVSPFVLAASRIDPSFAFHSVVVWNERSDERARRRSSPSQTGSLSWPWTAWHEEPTLTKNSLSYVTNHPIPLIFSTNSQLRIFLPGGPNHAGPWLRSIWAERRSDGRRRSTEHHSDVSAILFTQSESDRTTLEVCQTSIHLRPIHPSSADFTAAIE